METKNRYIIENEIKVKNLLSDIYENESSLLQDIQKNKDQLNELENEQVALVDNRAPEVIPPPYISSPYSEMP